MALTQIDDRGLKTPIDLLDNEKIRFGTGNDLEISHTGSYSLIFDSNNQSDLFIQTNERNITLKVSTTEDAIVCKPNSAVEHYYDNAKKVETTTDGIKLSGNGYADFPDNGRIRMGAGYDLAIWHDGSHNKIAGANGNTHIETGGTVEINKGTSENMAKFISDGAVELYHDNSLKFKTTSYGCLVGQTSSSSGASSPTRLSLGSDYHDAAGTDPKLSIWQSTDAGDHMGFGVSSTQLDVILTSDSYDFVVYGGASGDTERFRMYGDGTGIKLPDSSKAIFGTGDDLQIFHDGNSRIQNTNDSCDFRIQSNSIELKANSVDEMILKGVANGAVELYYDNVKKFETSSSGADFSVGTGEVDINSTGSGDQHSLRLLNSNASAGNKIGIYFGPANNVAGASIQGIAESDFTTTANRDGGLIFTTRQDGNWNERVRIDSSGNLGINESASNMANGKLTVKLDTNKHIAFNPSQGEVGSVPALVAFQDNGSLQDIGFRGVSVRFAAGSAERGRWTDSGLTFNGDTAGANALNDYEEGSFTPTWGTGGSAVSGITYSHQYGFYTKVGNLVHVMIWINTTGNDDTSSSDVLQLNLPFTSKSSSGYRGGMGYSFNGINVSDDYDDSDDQVTRTHLNYNVAWMEVGFGSNLNGGGWSSGAIRRGGIIDGSSGIQLQGTYLTD